MFPNTNTPGTDSGPLPDVCTNPSPSEPVPIPYPNIGNQGSTAAPVFFPISSPPVAGGVASGQPLTDVQRAFTVFKIAQPSADQPKEENDPGGAAVPSQIRVLILAP